MGFSKLQARNSTLLLRADASTQIGAGHVMRCLALAQAWQDAGGAAHFVAVEMPNGLQERLAVEDMTFHRLDVVPGSIEDAAQTIAQAQRLGAAWVAEDGYHFGADYQRAIKNASLRLLAIDDYGHADHYVADLVLNQNIYADASLYPSRSPGTRLMLGTQYVLLRREFLHWRGWQREIPDVARKVLVTMGGGDPENVTLKVIEALEEVQVDGLEVVVVVGAGNPHQPLLQSAIEKTRHSIRLEQNATDMAQLMAKTDVAISAAGSVCWELCFLGVPSLLLMLAENQRPLADGLANAGAMVNLGWHEAAQPSAIAAALQELLPAATKRHRFSERGRQLVVGDGPKSILRHLQSDQLTLRTVQATDCRLIWEWANDPVARRHSFSPETIPWEEHVEWFATRLADPNTRFFLASDADGSPVGYARFQLMEDSEAVISVAVAPAHRGHSYGHQLISLGAEAVCRRAGVKVVHAHIKPDNLASLRVFASAGFAEEGMILMNGSPAYHYMWQGKEEGQCCKSATE
ncbi:MAG: UDP-2,4-diacetamido-2,4,6-trideoxy-beta-L-altropyranose hydrolase [Caldilineaceae bacterium]|nr:UDP-2,4-diacetamido-2,4,6-trideoxy-beta-L-altropyranose hydrolase [Caldilineaceae bacterium]